MMTAITSFCFIFAVGGGCGWVGGGCGDGLWVEGLCVVCVWFGCGGLCGLRGWIKLVKCCVLIW